MTNTADPLWTHIKPLWLDFEKAGAGVLVAGDYGLFLKQQFLLGATDKPIVIPLERWPDAAPRATGDVDLIVALDLIADETANKSLFRALDEQGFAVSERPHGKRWQYFKEIGKLSSLRGMVLNPMRVFHTDQDDRSGAAPADESVPGASRAGTRRSRPSMRRTNVGDGSRWDASNGPCYSPGGL